MSDAHVRGWGDPSAKGYREQHIVPVRIGKLPTLYLRREVAPLFEGFLREIIARGYQLNNVADDWGLSLRAVRGYEKQWAATHDFRWLSNHSWGLALDLDSTQHPLGHHGTGIPQWVVDVGHRWGLFWGGNYSTRPDEMHWEFVGTPADVARYPLAAAVAPPPIVLPLAAVVAGSLEDAMRITIPVHVEEHRGYADLAKGFAGLQRTIEADKVLAYGYGGADVDPGAPGGADAKWGPHATAPLELVDHGGVARIQIPGHEVERGVISVYVTVAD